MVEDPPEIRDGSALCRACGLCCSGAFHDFVPLDPDELEDAARLHLPLVEREPLLAFRLPCPRQVERACTIYAERPHECAAFACALLASHREGRVSLQDALERVRATQGAFERADAAFAAEPAKAELSALRRRWFER